MIFIKMGEITPEKEPDYILNWFTKIMQKIRKSMSEKQFETVLAYSHP